MGFGKVATRTFERVTVNFIERTSRALRLSVRLSGDTRTDVINQDVQLGAYVRWILSRNGRIFVQEPGDKQPCPLQFLPGVTVMPPSPFTDAINSTAIEDDSTTTP